MRLKTKVCENTVEFGTRFVACELLKWISNPNLALEMIFKWLAAKLVTASDWRRLLLTMLANANLC